MRYAFTFPTISAPISKKFTGTNWYKFDMFNWVGFSEWKLLFFVLLVLVIEWNRLHWNVCNGFKRNYHIILSYLQWNLIVELLIRYLLKFQPFFASKVMWFFFFSISYRVHFNLQSCRDYWHICAAWYWRLRHRHPPVIRAISTKWVRRVQKKMEFQMSQITKIWWKDFKK